MAKRNQTPPNKPTSGGEVKRSRTIERRQEREKQKRRQQQTYIVIGVVAVAVIAFFLLIITSQPAEAPIPEVSAARYEGLQQSKTEKGFPLLGDPQATVQVVEYSSFDCPHCAEFHEGVFPGLVERVSAGDIAFIYVPLFGTGGINNGEGAARAAVCAGEQGKFWEMHDALFTWQVTYGQQAFSQNRLNTGVDNLGLNRDQYNQCMGGSLPGDVTTAALTEARSLADFTGTPAVYVNGAAAGPTTDAINSAINSALAQAGQTPGTVDETPEATVEATETVIAATQQAASEETESAPEATGQAVASAPTTPNVFDSVCLVTDVGHVNDGGFNQFANEGMERAAEEFGLKTAVIETQAPTDYAGNIDTCVTEGYDIIITVGFALADAMRAAAADHPDRFFIGADQIFVDPLPNMVGLQFREDQGGFLAGAMAALMTKTNKVAGIYGPEEPPILKFRNGFEQGVKFINSEVVALGVHIDDYVAPDRGAQAAEQFIGDGADVVFGAAGPTGSGGITRAAQSGVMVIGVDLDEYLTTFGGGETPGAENLVMSAIKRVDAGVYDMIKAIVQAEGFPTDSTYVLGASNGGISFSEAHDAEVPAEVTERLTEILAGLSDGTIETGVDPVTGVLLQPNPEATPES